MTLALFLLVVCSSLARGLGLGDITLHSRLDEPLNASIDLTQLEGVSADQINVDLALRENFERSGVDYPSFLDDVSFSVEVHDEETGVLTISTERPVPEPYLDLILDVRWPGGRLMREYTTLLEPSQASAAGPEAANRPVSSEGSELSSTESAEAGSPSQPAAESAADIGISDAGTEDSLRGGMTEDGEYRVGADETLWQIAAEMRQDDSVTVQQMMVAIQRENQNAFMDGNINTLRADAVLRIPELSDADIPGSAESLDEVRRQNRSAGLLDIAPLTPPVSGPTSNDDGDDVLRVLSAEEAAGAAEEGGSGQDEVNSQIELLDNIIDIEDDRIAGVQAGLAARAEEAAQTAATGNDAADTPRAGRDNAAETGAPAADTGMAATEPEAGTRPVEPAADAGTTLIDWLRNPLLLIDVVIVLVALVVWLLIVRRRRAERMAEQAALQPSYSADGDAGHLDLGPASRGLQRESWHDYGHGGEGREDSSVSLDISEPIGNDALTLEDVTVTERRWLEDNVTTESSARETPEDDDFHALIAEADRLTGPAAGPENQKQGDAVGRAEGFVAFNLATAADEDPVAVNTAASEAYPDVVDFDRVVDEQTGDDKVESFDFRRLDDLLPEVDESSGNIETAEYTTAEPDNDDAFDLGNLTFDENDLEAADDSDELADDEDEALSSRLDLAVAYEAMGDLEGAREILHQVLEDGDENDRAEARRLLDEWGNGGEGL